MFFHCLGYAVNAGVNDANVDMTALQDDIFTVRNSHYIFTEPLRMLAWLHGAASATRARLNSPTLNSLARYQVWPVERSATIPDRPAYLDLREVPLILPQNEEIAVEESNNLGAGNERTHTVMIVAPPGWNRTLAQGVPPAQFAPPRMLVRATATIVVSANAWSAGAAITFTETLKGGWYALIGAEAQGTSDIAFRFIFPRALQGARRQLRPGWIMQDAIGDTPDPMKLNGGLGTWGYFHSFEPPSVQVWALAAGATAIELRLLVAYLGDNAPVGVL